MSVFAKNLSKIRKLRGWSQSQLAELADLSLNSISFYERCKAWPSRENIETLAKILKVNEMEFFREEEAEPGGKNIPLLTREQLFQLVQPDLALEVLSKSKIPNHDILLKIVPPKLALEILAKAIKSKPPKN